MPPVRSCRRANGASSMPRSTARRSPRSIRSTRRRSASSRRPAARSSAPRRSASTARPPGSKRSAQACGVARAESTPRKPACLPAIRGALAATPIKGRITLSGYEGSELLVARLLVESGADLRYVGTACPRTRWSDPDREWLEAQRRPRPVPRLARAGSRGAARVQPDLAIGTTPVVQKAKEMAHPGALLHQPDLGAAADGPGRRRLARAGRQRRARQQGALRRDARLLRRRRQGRRGRRLGRRPARPAGVPQEVPRAAARPRTRLAAGEAV